MRELCEKKLLLLAAARSPVPVVNPTAAQCQLLSWFVRHRRQPFWPIVACISRLLPKTCALCRWDNSQNVRKADKITICLNLPFSSRLAPLPLFRRFAQTGSSGTVELWWCTAAKTLGPICTGRSRTTVFASDCTATWAKWQSEQSRVFFVAKFHQLRISASFISPPKSHSSRTVSLDFDSESTGTTIPAEEIQTPVSLK